MVIMILTALVAENKNKLSVNRWLPIQIYVGIIDQIENENPH